MWRNSCLSRNLERLSGIQRAFGIADIHLKEIQLTLQLLMGTELGPPGGVCLCLECLQLFTFACDVCMVTAKIPSSLRFTTTVEQPLPSPSLVFVVVVVFAVAAGLLIGSHRRDRRRHMRSSTN